MNATSYRRLFSVFIGFISLFISYKGFTTIETLSPGQCLMTGSLIPASLTLFTASFHRKKLHNEIVALATMFIGIFFFMLSSGMYLQTLEKVYAIFGWLSIMLCSTSIAMLLMYPTRQQIWRT